MKTKALFSISLVVLSSLGYATAESLKPANLNGSRLAHLAYIAENIDIRYANLVLTISSYSVIRA